MIGIILVMHDRLGEAFASVAEHVMGPQQNIKAFGIAPDDDMEKMEQHRQQIAAVIAAFDSGDGVLIFTDMFGGTPSNLSISFLKEGKIEVLAGTSLPSLIKALKCREENMPLDKIAEAAVEAGKKYFVVPSKTLTPPG